MRAIWSGSLSFGLINIPVKVYSASKDRALKFRMLEKHGLCPISYAKICRSTNKEVPYEDIVKGYEYEKGDYVVLTDEDFKNAAPRSTKTIDIINFVDEKEIDSKFIDKPYYIEPDKKSEKAYVLLREALKRSKKAGLARIVFKEKEHMCLVKPEDSALLLVTLRYEQEIRSPEDLHIPDTAKYSEKELEIAIMLIEQLEDHFDASKYRDTYTEKLQKVIERKAKGRPVKIAEEAMPQRTEMKEILEMLKKSLEEEKKKDKSHAPR